MTVLLRFVKDRRRALIGWSAGIAVFILFTVAFYPSFRDLPGFEDYLEDLPEAFRTLAGAHEDVLLTSPAGYLHSQLYGSMLPILFVVLGISLGARAIAGSEDDGTLELMLANPVTRGRVAMERYASAVAQLFGVGVVATVVTVVFSLPFGLMETPVTVASIGLATLGTVAIGVVFATVAFGVGAWFGGRGMTIGIAATLAVASYVLFGLVNAGIIEPARYVTPWWWYMSRNVVARGLPPESLWGPLAVSAAALVAGLWRFESRDLRSS